MPPSTLRRLAAASILSACLLGLTACGSGSATDVSQIKRTIQDFALARGAHSCDFLTVDALQGLFAGGGRTTLSNRRALVATCRKRSARFTGERVQITRVWFPAPFEAKAYANRIGAHSSYTVTLRKSRRRWRINHVTY